jgi:hypothetical protein
LSATIALKPDEFWRMSFFEFFCQVKGFYDRQEMEWKRVYVLWSAQIKEPPTFEEFMGRPKKPSDMTEEEILAEWEQVVG